MRFGLLLSRASMTAKRLPIIGCAGAFLLGGAFLQSGVHAAERSPITVSVVGAVEQIPATVIKLEGGGPFPAVVMMHDCSGLGPRSSGAPRRWADELVAQGYVVLIPDSFTPRDSAVESTATCVLRMHMARSPLYARCLMLMGSASASWAARMARGQPQTRRRSVRRAIPACINR